MTLAPQISSDIALNDERLAVLEKSVREIFSENDFHAADMRTIAKQSGMGFNTIYKYFGDKEGLLFHFVKQWQNDLNQEILTQISAQEDGKTALNKVLVIFLNYYQRNPDIGKIFFLTLPMNIWMDNESFAQRALIGTVLDIIKQTQSEGWVRKNIQPVAVLDMLMGMVHRAFTMWIYRGTAHGLKSQADDLFDLFWAAIAAKAHSA